MQKNLQAKYFTSENIPIYGIYTCTWIQPYLATFKAEQVTVKQTQIEVTLNGVYIIHITCITHFCSKLALCQQTDEHVLHSILVILVGRHVPADISVINKATCIYICV